jgi:hypothetical protein
MFLPERTSLGCSGYKLLVYLNILYDSFKHSSWLSNILMMIFLPRCSFQSVHPWDALDSRLFKHSSWLFKNILMIYTNILMMIFLPRCSFQSVHPWDALEASSWVLKVPWWSSCKRIVDAESRFAERYTCIHTYIHTAAKGLWMQDHNSRKGIARTYMQTYIHTYIQHLLGEIDVG